VAVAVYIMAVLMYIQPAGNRDSYRTSARGNGGDIGANVPSGYVSLHTMPPFTPSESPFALQLRAKRQCAMGEINAGRWEEGFCDDSGGDPECCGWDKSQFKTNPRVCGRKRMEFDSEHWYRGSAGNGFLTQGGGRMCACLSPPRPMCWVPSACTLAEWDPVAFCTALGTRTILFVGDSTVQQSAAALMNAVLWDGARQGVAQGGRCAAQVLYGLSDTLVSAHGGGARPLPLSSSPLSSSSRADRR
jgi:hypothetical protein